MNSGAKQLATWYEKHKRDLPWRHTRDPYHIWISEVILQQTRVAQGLPYYHRFTTLFPTVEALANAPQDAVLKCWQGLGYYSRARNMHHTAKLVLSQHAGVFPKQYSELIKLKGIGPYTAAAVASFANREKVAVVDGNVIRVLARIFLVESPVDLGQTKKEIQQLADEFLEEPSDLYNQAIMELGALICTPKSPKCQECPVQVHCLAFAQQKQNQLPHKQGKTKQRNRYLNYLVIGTEERFYIKQRGEGDIWAGLYDFPVLETQQEVNHPAELGDIWPWLQQPEIRFDGVSEPYQHQLSHQKLHAKFWTYTLDGPITQADWIEVNAGVARQYPVPKLISNFLERSKLAEK
ncbi:MAG TPA: A/G-specific adenine glycosylase [Luteibaculaceae bacterium]|nr:A/G-specific adenine glycosylase [Luteibaculaceae bacterium]